MLWSSCTPGVARTSHTRHRDEPSAARATRIRQLPSRFRSVREVRQLPLRFRSVGAACQSSVSPHCKRFWVGVEATLPCSSQSAYRDAELFEPVQVVKVAEDLPRPDVVSKVGLDAVGYLAESNGWIFGTNHRTPPISLRSMRTTTKLE